MKLAALGPRGGLVSPVVASSPVEAAGAVCMAPVLTGSSRTLPRRQAEVTVAEEAAAVVCVGGVDISTQIVAGGALQGAGARGGGCWHHHALAQRQFVFSKLILTHGRLVTAFALRVRLASLSRTCGIYSDS